MTEARVMKPAERHEFFRRLQEINPHPKSDASYIVDQLFLAERQHRFRRVGDGEQFLCRDVDTLVGCLRGEDDGNEQFKRGTKLKIRLRMRIDFL